MDSIVIGRKCIPGKAFQNNLTPGKLEVVWCYSHSNLWTYAVNNYGEESIF